MHADEHAFYTSKMGILPDVTRETFYRNRDQSPLTLAHHLTPFDQKIYCALLVEIQLFAAFILYHPRALFIKHRRVRILVQKNDVACIYRIGMQSKHSSLLFLYFVFLRPVAFAVQMTIASHHNIPYRISSAPKICDYRMSSR